MGRTATGKIMHPATLASATAAAVRGVRVLADGKIGKADLDLILLTDDPDEAVATVTAAHQSLVAQQSARKGLPSGD